MRTDFLDVEVLQTDLTSSIGFDRFVTPLAAAISELRIDGAPFESLSPQRATSVTWAADPVPTCGVDGQVFRTRVTTSSAASSPARRCRPTLCGSTTI